MQAMLIQFCSQLLLILQINNIGNLTNKVTRVLCLVIVGGTIQAFSLIY